MNNLTNFNDLFSQMRLSSYNDDIVKHYDNLKLVGKITPKIATLEIILRNKLDNKLSEKDSNWIKNSNDENIKKAKDEIENREKNKTLSHHQYLSCMSLGTIIYLIKKINYKIL
ncbi:CAAX protease [Campylobacter jejuni]|uniref:CAAX protease n=1 Tax=Campylobacter jejuni TaxID=197 RepID=UPI001BAA12A1|nr:CAAX protease [Campylobacter jejuni]MBR8636210.1 CAAX protease [Campylobacter jejuni]QUJ29552.1 CAAX protease [Campylobacter jejuni]